MPDTTLARVPGLLVPARRSHAGRTHWAPLVDHGIDESHGYPLYVCWSLCTNWTPTEVKIPGITVDCGNCLRAAKCETCREPAVYDRSVLGAGIHRYCAIHDPYSESTHA